MTERIGIDFDNTIICYDKVFNKVGVEKKMIPEDLPEGKGFVRDYLRQEDMEKEWIWLQGYVYGTRLSDAKIYNGVFEFLDYCDSKQIECFVVSHKSVYPYSGDKYNLHKAASGWIQENNLGIQTYFELTKEDKVKRIADLGCTLFIDDLPEFLSLPGFPDTLTKVLFDPLKKYTGMYEQFNHSTSWGDILSQVKRMN